MRKTNIHDTRHVLELHNRASRAILSLSLSLSLSLLLSFSALQCSALSLCVVTRRDLRRATCTNNDSAGAGAMRVLQFFARTREIPMEKIDASRVRPESAAAEQRSFPLAENAINVAE